MLIRTKTYAVSTGQYRASNLRQQQQQSQAKSGSQAPTAPGTTVIMDLNSCEFFRVYSFEEMMEEVRKLPTEFNFRFATGGVYNGNNNGDVGRGTYGSSNFSANNMFAGANCNFNDNSSSFNESSFQSSSFLNQSSFMNVSTPIQNPNSHRNFNEFQTVCMPLNQQQLIIPSERILPGPNANSVMKIGCGSFGSDNSNNNNGDDNGGRGDADKENLRNFTANYQPIYNSSGSHHNSYQVHDQQSHQNLPSASASTVAYPVETIPRPDLTYMNIITMAIEANQDKQATLSEIYAFFVNFPYYAHKSDTKWKNSIRHCLSFNDCFVKVI